MADIRELQDLYEQGRSTEIVEIVENLSLEEKTPEVQIILAWALFRLGKHEESFQIAKELSEKGDKSALELIAQIAAYASKDDKTLAKIRKIMISGTPSICNAFAIRARDADSEIPTELIVDAALRSINSDEIGAINLLNNTGRLLLAKSKNKEGILAAICFWNIALIKYGSGDKNLHHRAAVYFWLSKAFESIEIKDLALNAAYESYDLWKRQYNLDPKNKQFRDKLAGAWGRIKELVGV